MKYFLHYTREGVRMMLELPIERGQGETAADLEALEVTIGFLSSASKAGRTVEFHALQKVEEEKVSSFTVFDRMAQSITESAAAWRDSMKVKPYKATEPNAPNNPND